MTTTNDQKTLAQRMTEGKIPVAEALHYAMSLAEALRKLHDAGKFHGALTPSSVAMTGTGLDLIPSLGAPATATPYTAPEIVQGQRADSRSDIFSFGTIVFEMLTGGQAFDGISQTELKLALCNSVPPPSGSPAVDRLVAGCVAKSPAARMQRMQKILMELKLLTVAARRADAGPATRGVSDGALRAEVQQLEARLATRLAGYEKTMASMQQSVAHAVQSLKDQLTAMQGQLAAVQQQPAPGPSVDVSGIEEAVAAIGQRMTTTEKGMEDIRGHFATLQSNMAADLHDFEKSLKTQGTAIESARTAMAQTDDLVERVVEALELLQTSMIDQHETAGVN